MPENARFAPRRITFTSADDSSMMNDVNQLNTNLDNISKERNIENEKLKQELDEKVEIISNLELTLQAKNKLYEDLMKEKEEVEREIDDYRLNLMRFSAYEGNLKKKDEELNNSLIKIKQLEQTLKNQKMDLDNLKLVIEEKDIIIQKMSEEVENYRSQCNENERMIRELDKLKTQVTSYNDIMAEKQCLLKKLENDLTKYVKMENDLLDKANACDKILEDNNQLQNDVESLKRELSLKTFALEKCKFDLHDMEQKFESLNMNKNDHDSIPEEGNNLSVAEIAAKLDRELNYAAELDDNLIKAIESESDINSELDELGNKGRSKYQEKMKKLEDELDNLKKQYQKVTTEYEEEKKNFDVIQMQDASLIEAIRIRLEAALDNENVLKKLLETERHKTESLASQLTGVQRTKSFDNYLLFNKNTQFNDSPRRQAKLNEYEGEVMMRLESEIKLLSSQNERERERVSDLQKVLDNERDRFSKALADQQEYSDQMKKEIKRLSNSKEKLEMELDQLHSLKLKYYELEGEKEKLLETIRSLRQNENSHGGARPKYRQNNDESDKFMEKLREINKTISENVRENHQMAETLHMLTEERRILQQRIAELESSNNLIFHHSQNNHDLEERANHLFAKYMRCESFRKALIYQKKFLLITIATTIGLSNDNMTMFKADSKKKKSFR